MGQEGIRGRGEAVRLKDLMDLDRRWNLKGSVVVKGLRRLCRVEGLKGLRRFRGTGGLVRLDSLVGQNRLWGLHREVFWD